MVEHYSRNLFTRGDNNRNNIMKEFTFKYTCYDSEITVSAKNGDIAFQKAIKELKQELEDNCYSGDLQEIEDEE
jgi:hypothetical protein